MKGPSAALPMTGSREGGALLAHALPVVPQWHREARRPGNPVCTWDTFGPF